MRMLPTRTAAKQPLLVKGKLASEVKTFLAPIKGLNLSVKNSVSDPLYAPILTNFVISEDTIDCRPGYAPFITHPDAKPVPSLMPYTGPTQKLIYATNGKLCTGTTNMHTGYLSDDWSWTMFANLGSTDYLLMANGRDGVWSWDGVNASGLVKETITAAASATWFNADIINIVLSHQNRVFMTDTRNLVIYYLPLQQKNGEVKQIPLSAIFKRGGTIRAMFSWGIDGGTGMQDRLVIFTDQNECAIYRGTDPDTDFSLTAVFRFDSPMSKHCVTNYGGDLYVLISTGLVPMSTLLRAESEQLGQTDRAVVSEFQDIASRSAGVHGWGVYMDYSSGRLICNLPLGADNNYRQMCRKMPSSYWTSWSNVPAHSWCWLDRKLYFGDDKGRIWIMDPVYLSDNGNPIHVDVQFAWNSFGNAAYKDFKMVRLWLVTDGAPQPFVDVKADYDASLPQNRPEVAVTPAGAEWNAGTWDEADWASGEMTIMQWNGVAAKGNVAAIRASCDVIGCTFKIKGADVVWEPGSIMG